MRVEVRIFDGERELYYGRSADDLTALGVIQDLRSSSAKAINTMAAWWVLQARDNEREKPDAN